MNKYLIFGFFFLYSNLCLAQTPTIVFGEAATPHGGTDTLLLEQPENGPNPLGNPIVLPQEEQSLTNTTTKNQILNKNDTNQPDAEASQNTITQNLPANPQPSAQYTLQKEDSMIQNTIYRGADRLYDIQSIPLKELDKINVQGLEPDLTTYPVR